MKKFVLFVVLMILLGCSKDRAEVPGSGVNTPPEIVSRSFEINENVGNSTSIGFVMAEDIDGDLLRFEIDTGENTEYAVMIDSDTGELRVSDASFFDYETNQSLTVPIIVFDADSRTRSEITIYILDVVDGSLSGLQKAFLEEFRYVTYNLSPTSFGASLSEKWTKTLRLFLEGDVSNAYIKDVQDALNEFNALFLDGFEIVLTDRLEQADVHAIRGSLDSVKDVFPGLYDMASQGNFVGYALYGGDGDFSITSGQVWLKGDTDMGVFKHEIGHIIGLGHSSNGYCGENAIAASVMCSSPGAEFTATDKGILSGLYHPEITAGKTFSQLEPVLETLLLNGTISP